MMANVKPSVNIAIPATVDESALPNQGEGRVPPASQARELRPGTESGAPNEGRGAGSSSSALQQWSPFHEAFRYLLQKHQRSIVASMRAAVEFGPELDRERQHAQFALDAAIDDFEHLFLARIEQYLIERELRGDR